jgi:hypothetical protein
MATANAIYQKELHDKLGFFATWLPGDAIALGDIGVLQAGRFRKQTSLAELNIAEEAGPVGVARNVQYASTSGMKVSLAGEGQIASVASAEVQLEFSHQGAFVFHAMGLREQKLENRRKLFEAIESAAQTGDWEKEYLLVEASYVADSATIMIAEEDSASVVLAASSKIPIASLQLADPKLQLSIRSQQGRIVQVIGGKGLHPLYSCLRVKQSWWSGPKTVPVRGAGENPLPSDVLERLSLAELLQS